MVVDFILDILSNHGCTGTCAGPRPLADRIRHGYYRLLCAMDRHLPFLSTAERASLHEMQAIATSPIHVKVGGLALFGIIKAGSGELTVEYAPESGSLVLERPNAPRRTVPLPPPVAQALLARLARGAGITRPSASMSARGDLSVSVRDGTRHLACCYYRNGKRETIHARLGVEPSHAADAAVEGEGNVVGEE